MITLTHSSQEIGHIEDNACTSNHVWPLISTASEPVFVYARDKSEILYFNDTFLRVATVTDLEILTSDAPPYNGCLFLASSTTFHSRSLEDRELIELQLDLSIQDLNSQLDAKEGMKGRETINSNDMIELIRESLTDSIQGDQPQHVWPLKITAISTDGQTSENIFVFHASQQDDLYCGDIFEAVASSNQMTDIPVDNPGMDANGELVPYYRKAELTFMARNPEEAEELWAAIIEDVDELTQNLMAVSSIQEIATYTSTGT